MEHDPAAIASELKQSIQEAFAELMMAWNHGPTRR